MAQLSVQVPASCARHALPFSTSRQHGLLMPKTSISTAARSFMAFRSQQRRAQCLIIKAEGDGDGNSAPPAELQDKEELPPWLRKEQLEKLRAAEESGSLPFAVYLLGSVLVSIAAVGSIFEIINKNPVFGVIQPDSPLWLPILGLFAVTGLPTAGWLFLKGVQGANALSERLDKIDGR